ncbi:protein TILLER ANGLE CONTROL 1-like [Phragmites australis]|uniref:protein TILLER ANGLE CONTROL 1-like n=1 Tax=Phragmites australis TaxID=29695 RepID=UPI002D785027|nr:protein TILLER ANGLE CONTROL 1-like [Phragmites australis]
MGLKVFNWLNLKMPSNTEYRTIHGSKAMEDKEDSVAEKDTEALLLRDVLLSGILAIGTLGHHVDLCPEACVEEEKLLTMGEEKVEEEKYEEERNDKVKEVALATAPPEPAPVVVPAKMHSSSMKEDTFTCFVKEEILMDEVEEAGVANIQERPLLMVEKVEKVRTTLADLFAAEAFSSGAPGEKNCQNVTIVSGASTSKPTSCMEKMHQKKPTKPTPKSLKATRKLSQVMRKMLGKKIHPEQVNGRSNAKGPLTA